MIRKKKKTYSYVNTTSLSRNLTFYLFISRILSVKGKLCKENVNAGKENEAEM